MMNIQLLEDIQALACQSLGIPCLAPVIGYEAQAPECNPDSFRVRYSPVQRQALLEQPVCSVIIAPKSCYVAQKS